MNWRHENLMRLFFRALRSFMKPGGIVKAWEKQKSGREFRGGGGGGGGGRGWQLTVI